MGAQNTLSSNKKDSIEKSFVREDGQAIIVCPACRTVRKIAVNTFSERRTKLKLKCSCAHVFRVSLDYRQTYRKATDLVGVCKILTPFSVERIAKIKNISFDGICFEAEVGKNIRAGQEGDINFVLDDKKRTPIRKEFSIQSVSGNIIGCKFKKVKAYEKELGFYLRLGA